MMDWYKFTGEVSRKFMAHEFRRLQSDLDKIITQNDQIRSERGNEKTYGFVFDGINYRLETPPVFHPHLPGSEFEVDDDITAHMRDRKKIDRDNHKIRQIVTLLLMPVESYQEARNALPDEIAECHPNTSKLKRTGEMESYIFDERTKRHEEELRDLIAFYSATRLIY